MSEPYDPNQLTLKQLIDQTGESERTLRYYMQLGLLDGPTSSGSAARYTIENIKRVAHIRQRQREGVGLREIQRELAAPAKAQQASLFSPTVPPTVSPTAAMPALDALEYLQRQGLVPPAPRPAPRPRRPGWPPDREQWERQVLDDGIELWVRRPLDPHRQKLLHQLLDRAEELFSGTNRSNP
jgi:hypothetical protein